METVYLGLIVFLFILAIFDLFVGVSNDAVNFLNSAIGAKVAKFRTVLIIAAVGVFVGATMSNGMMDIARHGIFQPQMFCFEELLCIFLAVMVTDVVLLDTFNTLGMPTSTTVSLVFEMLGGTFILALLKIFGDGSLTFAQLLNTEKALSVIMGIFCSVAIAFAVGAFVQWVSRVIFTFSYKKHLTWTIGLFGGIATTSIVYFALIKGLKGSTIMTKDAMAWVQDNTTMIVLCCFVGATILMQLLHWFGVSVFKIVIFMGTFALALAFAGNDLVNFIGVPLAALSAFQDFTTNGAGVDASAWMMGALNEKAATPFLFLLGAGIIMVVALATSKKAQNVVKTSVDLSRQDEGEEMFGSSRMARIIVRGANAADDFVGRITPAPVSRWIDSRFNRDEIVLENGAAFDLVRASVNLVVAGLLIVFGTSLKLPLSTTYVTFLVAMGTSLADRAWGRESAVFRITGVLNVIGGWFLTAIIAFTACAFVTAVMFYGGTIAKLIFVIVAIIILVKSNFFPKKDKDALSYEEQLFREMMSAGTPQESWAMLKRHVGYTQHRMLDFVRVAYGDVANGFAVSNLRGLNRALKGITREKESRKRLRRRELAGMLRIDKDLALEKNTWFHLAANSGEQMIYCLSRMAKPCKEHVDNNFNPLPRADAEDLLEVGKQVTDLVARSLLAVESADVQKIDALLAEEDAYKDRVSDIRNAQENHLQTATSQGIKVSLVYLNLLQETQELLSAHRHYLRALKLFHQ